MHSLLFGNSSDESNKRYFWSSLLTFEVSLLKKCFGLSMRSRCFCPQNTASFILPDTVRKWKGVRMLPENSSKWRFLEQLNFIGVRNCTPIIASLKGALGWINYQFIVSILDIPLGRQSHKPLQVAILHFGIESALIQWIKVVANMHKLSSIEHLISPVLHVRTHESAHPVVGYHNRWEYFELAKTFERS